jgi:hypothetical protein
VRTSISKRLRVMLTCALKVYVKVSKNRKLHLIAQQNLMFKKYNAPLTRDYCYIWFEGMRS